MYLSFHPMGTSGHRASALMGFVPYNNYAVPGYGHRPSYPPAPVGHLYAAAPVFDGHATNPAPSAGGISAVMEYDAGQMAAFMCWCSFGMLGQSRTPTKQLEASVVSILHATRLPKLTILIALEYLNQRYAACPCVSMPELDVFVKLVVALVLANKFNDDNTFTNKSWCGASGVLVGVLNASEREWLAAVSWNLNVVGFQNNIETLDDCWASWVHKLSLLPWAPGYAPAGYCNQSPPATRPGPYSALSLVPSSPLFDSTSAPSAYCASLPVMSASPVKFSQDWSVPDPQSLHYLRPVHYAAYAPQQSIWAYPPTAYPPMPPPSDAAYPGLPNPYYTCLASY